MLKKANIQWTAKQLCNQMNKDNINFENAVQRSLCWDTERKSLLIHSMIAGYPIPGFYAVKNNKKYDMLDGKQRSHAIYEFINGKYALSENLPEVENSDGVLTSVAELHFTDLLEEYQEAITGYSLTIYYFEDITDDEIAEMFFRLNNGKPLSAFELTRTKAKSIETIKEIAQHEIFKTALTEKALSKYKNEDIVTQTWVVLNVETPSFVTKDMRPLITEMDITQEQKYEITEIYDVLLETNKSIIGDNKDKKHCKIAKRILTKTHFVSIVPVIKYVLDNDVKMEMFKKWLLYFYDGAKSTTNNETYNQAARDGSSKPENIRKRKEILLTSIKEYCT